MTYQSEPPAEGSPYFIIGRNCSIVMKGREPQGKPAPTERESRGRGPPQMPVREPLFGKMDTTDPQEKLLRISNLSRFPET